MAHKKYKGINYSQIESLTILKDEACAELDNNPELNADQLRQQIFLLWDQLGYSLEEEQKKVGYSD